MHTFRILAVVFSMVTSAVALAQSPYVISGLHTDLILTEAVAQAEKLGGACQVSASRPNKEGKSVQCAYSHCPESSRAGECEEEGYTSTGPTFSAYPIVSIGLVAPADSAPLTRIVMVYKGGPEAVAADLIEAFGPTKTGGAPTDKKTWSNARRWSWTQGHYLMGLLDSPHLIILATDPSLVSVAEDSQPQAEP